MATVATVATTDSIYCDITHLLHLPQVEAAKQLGMAPSSLCKRWKEAVPKDRAWPHRGVHALDNEINSILENLPRAMPLNVEEKEYDRLKELLAKRRRALSRVTIRIGGGRGRPRSSKPKQSKQPQQQQHCFHQPIVVVPSPPFSLV